MLTGGINAPTRKASKCIVRMQMRQYRSSQTPRYGGQIWLSSSNSRPREIPRKNGGCAGVFS